MQNVFPVITAMRSYSTSWEQDKPPFCMFSFLCVSISTLHSRALYCVSSVHSKLLLYRKDTGGVCAVVALTAHYKSTLAISSPNWIVATVVADSARHHIHTAAPANVKQKMRRRNVSHERIEPCGVWVLDKNEWRKTKKENIVCECGRCGGFARM